MIVDEILYDYIDKIITKKQVYKELSIYGYSKKQIKGFLEEDWVVKGLKQNGIWYLFFRF